MGGNAFKGVETPRLHQKQYERLQAKIQALLEPHFGRVATPAQDPDKSDHGDVDFIVHTPADYATVEYIGHILGAQDIVAAKPTSNYLIAFEGLHAQVDVHRCEQHEFPLRLFLNSYGRLGHVLSAMLLRFQLFFDKRGLWLGKPTTLQPTYLLSIDLTEILRLLNLDHPAYLRGFSSRRDVFEWMEAGSIDDVPIIRGWRGATMKAGDAFMEEWAARRAGEDKIEIDKAAIRAYLLRATGKEKAFEVWQQELQDKQAREAKIQERSRAVKEEVNRRMEGCMMKGKAIKEEAGRIRAEVEASIPAVGD